MTHQFSRAGQRHLAAGRKNEDAFAIREDDRYTVMALADGASGCSHAGQGAQLCCDTAARLLLGCAAYFLDAQPETVTKILLRNIRYALDKQAAQEKIPVEAFSSTLACALYDRREQKLLLFRLGDGLVLGSRENRCTCLLRPDSSAQGTCVTTTRGADSRCSVQLLDAAGYRSVMLLTDGAWRAMVTGGRLSPAAEDAVVRGDDPRLRQLLRKAAPNDDHSYLILTTA